MPSAALMWLGAAVALCYWNALGGVFQFDDYNVIVLNPAVTDGLSQGSIGIRPLLKLTYRWDWFVGGGSELPFHLTNLLIHWGNACLVWWLARRLMRSAEGARFSEATALAAAALFVAHPLHTEAVTYVCGRSTSLMALFYLGAMAVHERGHASPGEKRWMWMAAALFALALSVKETAVTLPAALWLWDRAMGRNTGQALKAAWPSWALLLLAALYFLFDDAYLAHMQRSVEFNSLSGNFATQWQALPYLARQWLLPLWPNIDPDLQALTDANAALYAVALLAVLCAFCVACWNRWRLLAFALAWALLHLVPLYLLLPRLDVANDRQWYLAGWPLCVVTVAVLARAGQRRGRALLAALLTAVCGLTLLRNADYRSEVALWEQTVALSPNKARVHNNLGYAYLLQGRRDSARAEFEEALRLDPQQIQAKFNLRTLK